MNTSKFQIITIAIFVICIIVGVALFATYKSESTNTELPVISIWGTFPAESVNNLMQKINSTSNFQISINYTQKSKDKFDQDFIEALARGAGPDAILIPQNMILRHRDKVLPIPYSILSERDFKNTYIAQAELYLSNDGALAIPFTIDPLVMYWNKDIFTNARIALPPKYWDEFDNLISKINTKDSNSNIRRTAIAMGEFANINNAKEILGSLILQYGNPVVSNKGDALVSSLGDGQYSGSRLTTSAVELFTKFSDPNNADYSWNRSLPNSKSAFLSGSLATYFGFASELFDIKQKNVNISFDVTTLPQIRDAKNSVNYGSMYGLSIVKASKNQSSVYTIFKILTDPSALASLNQITYLPPVRRDMIATGSSDPYQSIFYDAALISKSWLDMNSSRTNQIFQKMIESITSGRTNVYDAIQTASGELDLSLQNPLSVEIKKHSAISNMMASVLDYSGFVKCDGVLKKGETYRDKVCDFKALIDTILGLITWMFLISIPIATAMFAWAGLLYMTGISKNISKAKSIFVTTAIGFIIMLVAWIGVRTIVDYIAKSDSGVTTFIK